MATRGLLEASIERVPGSLGESQREAWENQGEPEGSLGGPGRGSGARGEPPLAVLRFPGPPEFFSGSAVCFEGFCLLRGLLGESQKEA
jgi:hypothetical protein